MSFFRVTAASLALMLAVSGMPAVAGSTTYHDDETPEDYAMVADALIARPMLAVATTVGMGVYLVTLPFAWASGSASKTWKALVVEPGKATFVRCLGCTKPGYGNANDQ